MTAQISDFARYRGRKFDLAGVSGSGLFDPEAYGLQPVATCTACWRGYVCGYLVKDEQLLLDELSLSLSTPPQPLFGVEPAPVKDGIFAVQYKRLAHPVSYTGGLLLARDFIQELYVHMGYHPAWKFRDVHELIFDEGRLIAAEDRSAQMAERRDQLENKPLRPGDPGGPTDIRAWIEKCFRQDY